MSGNPAGRPRAAPKRTRRTDDYENVATGLGRYLKDKRTAGFYAANFVTDAEARDIWRGSGLAARVVELVPTHEMREGFEICLDEGEKDEAEEIQSDLEGYGLQCAWTTARNYERAYGGGAIFPIANDGQDLAAPLNEKGYSEVEGLHVFEPRELTALTWYENPFDRRYGRPETYLLQRIAGGGRSSTTTVIHESRLVLFPGIRVSREDLGPLAGWGDSIFTRILSAIKDLDSSFGGVAALMQHFAQSVYKLQGIDKLIVEGGTAGAEAVTDRLITLEYQRSVLRAVALDREDEFQQVIATLSGVPDTLDRFMMLVSAVTGIPVTILMGRSPAGLNATGDSDTRSFYDLVGAEREARRDQLEKLVRFFLLAKDGPTAGVEPDVWSVKWRPLWQQSDTETATARKTQAEADKIYLEAGVLTPLQVARSRFSGDEFSYETKVDGDELNQLEQQLEEAADLAARSSEAELAATVAGTKAVEAKAAGGEEEGPARRDGARGRVVRRGDSWVVYSADREKVLGVHQTRRAAERKLKRLITFAEGGDG